jgi:hypothetical protein
MRSAFPTQEFFVPLNLFFELSDASMLKDRLSFAGPAEHNSWQCSGGY